jgi:ribosomal protein S21
MVIVNVRNHGDFDKALRAFKAKVRKAQILEISQRKAFYISPSEKKHRRRYKRVK